MRVKFTVAYGILGTAPVMMMVGRSTTSCSPRGYPMRSSKKKKKKKKWITILRDSAVTVMIPRIPFQETTDPILVYSGGRELCFLKSELEQRRDNPELVFIDVAVEGVVVEKRVALGVGYVRALSSDVR